jgi:hypothetical protein
MKKSVKCVSSGMLLVGVFCLCLSTRAFADGTPELKICSGGCGVIVGSGNSVATTNYTTANGWTISVVAGVSNSPSLVPVGLNLSSIAVSCKVASCEGAPLDIFLSDVGFTELSPFLFSTLTVLGQGGADASSDEKGYFDSPGNTYFGLTTLIGTTPSVNGNVNILSPVTVTVTGGGPPSSPYSLTLETIFNAGGHAAKFTSDGAIGPLPEPGSMLLMGAGLLAMGGVIRHRRRAT